MSHIKEHYAELIEDGSFDPVNPEDEEDVVEIEDEEDFDEFVVEDEPPEDLFAP